MTAPPLRHALRRDLPVIADIWVDAFSRDPYLRWIVPDDGQWPAFGKEWMTFIVERTFERGHTYLADPDDVAVAWIPPDLTFAGPADVERGRGIVASYASEARADEVVATVMAARAQVPEEPHWTLQYLGVRCSRQGRGLGAPAVAPVLELCDAEGLPGALVSTNPRNVAFYERQGFRLQGGVTTPDGAATMRPMYRSPR